MVSHLTIFTARHYANTVYAVIISLSVRPFVPPSVRHKSSTTQTTPNDSPGILHCVSKKVYHPTSNNNFSSSCPISVIFDTVHCAGDTARKLYKTIIYEEPLYIVSDRKSHCLPQYHSNVIALLSIIPLRFLGHIAFIA